ncbi:MAG: GtrA family protein [Mesorhizobium sp.]
MTGAPQRRPLAVKMVRFGLVGVANTAIDLAVFTVLVLVGMGALPANLVAWATAVSFSYLANSRWSFEASSEVGPARSALRFFSLGALISLGLSSGALVVLAGTIGVMPAKIVGVVAAAVLNFLAARWAIENRLLPGSGRRD